MSHHDKSPVLINDETKRITIEQSSQSYRPFYDNKLHISGPAIPYQPSANAYPGDATILYPGISIVNPDRSIQSALTYNFELCANGSVTVEIPTATTISPNFDLKVRFRFQSIL